MGWVPPVDYTGGTFAPVGFRTPARTAARHELGEETIVVSEYVRGHAQIVLRSSNDWSHALQLSQSSGAALDPSLALLPNGDLGVVWSDTRHGRNEIYYRSRIRGRWTDEHLLVSLSGSCRTPALAADARGGMYMAFQYQNGDSLQLKFERFGYAWPIGQPATVVASQVRPDNPTICAAADGHGYILWQDRGANGKLWFASFHPDSGVRSIQPLADNSVGTTAYAAALDSSGTLYVLWHQSGAFVNELLLQVRGGLEGPLVREDDFESLSLPLETLAMDVDAQRSVHIAYALVSSTGLKLRYRNKPANDAWDVTSTDLSFPGNDTGGQPILLPRRDGNVDVAYTGTVAQQSRFMIRRRIVAPERTTDVGGEPPIATLAPNPAPAGAGIVARAGTQFVANGAMLDIFDTSGRRMISVPMLGGDARWSARVPAGASRQWPAGVYFARLRNSRQWSRLVVVH